MLSTTVKPQKRRENSMDDRLYFIILVILPLSVAVNIAANKPTQQSSTHGTHTSSKAVDGDLRQHYSYCTHTVDEKDPWWRVDLLAVYSISAVTIVNRNDCCGERLHNFVVKVTNISSLSAPYQQCSFYPGKASTGATLPLNCSPHPVFGRYLYIQIFDGFVALTLCEVQVDGVAISSGTILPNKECKIDTLGQTYSGLVKTTRGNIHCQRWDSQTPRSHSVRTTRKLPDDTLHSAADYCRNPDDSPDGPWCYHATGSDRWSYCEVYRCPFLSTNIALDKPAVQSSTRDAGGAASRAVDGNRNTDFEGGNSCSHTEDGSNNWWRVDLQNVYAVYTVGVTNRQHTNYHRTLANFDIRVSNSEHLSPSAPLCHHFGGTVGAGITQWINCDNAVYGRYLFIQQRGTEPLVMCEVEVYGTLVPSYFGGPTDVNEMKTPGGYLSIFTDLSVDSDGFLIGWKLNAARPGTVWADIWRQKENSVEFTLVHKAQVIVTYSGEQEMRLTNVVQVKQGDVIGYHYASNIPSTQTVIRVKDDDDNCCSHVTPGTLYNKALFDGSLTNGHTYNVPISPVSRVPAMQALVDSRNHWWHSSTLALSDNKVTLTFQAWHSVNTHLPTATKFVVQYKLNTSTSWSQVGGDITPSLLSNGVVQREIDLTTAGLYKFNGQVVYADGIIEWTSAKSIMFCTRPSPVQNLAVTSARQDSSTKATLTLTWDEPSSVNCNSILEYRIVFKKNSDPSWGQPQTAQSRSHTLRDLDAYIRYDVAVTAVNDMSLQSAAEDMAIRTAQTVPGPVTSLSVTPSSTSLLISWGVPAQPNGVVIGYIVGYRLMKRVACSTTSPTGFVYKASSVSQYTFDGLEEYAQYEVTIQARTSVGNGESSNKHSITLEAVPSVAPQLSFTVTSRTMTLTFSMTCEDMNGGNGVYRYQVDGGDPVFTTRTQVTVPGLTPYTSYSVKMSYCNSKGCGLEKNVQIKTDQDVPGPVGNLKVILQSANSIIVSWSLPDTPNGVITKYHVEHKLVKRLSCPTIIVEGSYDISETPNGGIYQKVLESLELNADYSIRVRAFTIKGGGSYQLIQRHTSATVPDLSIAAPAISDVKARQFTVSWNAVLCKDIHGEFTNYTVMVTDVTGSESAVYSSDTTNMNVIGQRPYTHYSVVVKVCNVIGCSSYGDASTTTTDQAVPSMPAHVGTISINDTSLLVTWSQPLNPNGIITGYRVNVWTEGETSTNVTRSDLSSKLNNTAFHHLEPFTVYSIQVFAKTIKGYGEGSKIITGVTAEGKPEKPVDVQNITRSDTSLGFQWKQPVNPRGKISGYKISCQFKQSLLATDGTSVSKQLGVSLVGTIKGLLKASLYECTVTGKTSAGYGDPSDAVLVWTAPPTASDLTELVKIPHVRTLETEATDTTVTVQLLPAAAPPSLTPSHYILVVETKSVRRKRDISPCRSQVNPALVTYADSQSQGLSCYVAALLNPSEVSSDGTKFVIGDGKTYNGYVNKPLEKGESYDVYYGATVNVDGSSSTAYQHVGGKSHQAKQFVDSGAIGGSVSAVVVILVVVVIVVIIVIHRRRQNRPQRHAKKNGAIEVSELQNVAAAKVNDDDVTSDVKIQLDIQDSDDSGDGRGALFHKDLESETDNTDDIYGNVGQVSGRRKTTEFLDYVNDMNKRGRDAYRKEYSNLQSDLVQPHKHGAKQENKKKNRYGNIIPYDKSRVVLEMLPNNPHSDYINATHIVDFSNVESYIASQGPNSYTVDDFMRMVWETRTNRIVMLTNLVESGKRKCEKYWPNLGTSKTHGDISVTLIQEDVLPEYTIRTLSFTKFDELRQVKQFHFTVWPDHGVPKVATSLLNFRRKVHLQDGTSEGPVVVHCSAGVGRTGTYIALDLLLVQHRADDMVDVFGCVEFLRNQRVNMVQTQSQYHFLHNAVAEAIRCGETVMECASASTTIPALMTKNRQTGKSTLDSQFELLQKVRTLEFSEDDHHDPDDPIIIAGLMDDNVDKNRDKSIYPTNSNRPILMTPMKGRGDYINATFVGDNIIMTQMPYPDDIVDFWRMVYDHDVDVIVMLNELDRHDSTCVQYWPTKQEIIGVFNVEVVSEVKRDCYMKREIKVERVKKSGDETKTVCHIQLTSWPKGVALPKNPYDLITVMEEVNQWIKTTSSKRFAVHCLNGAERSGLYLALVTACEKIQLEQEVDVFQAVKHIRQFRPQCISSVIQYKMIYDAVLNFIESYQTYSNFK